MYPLTLEVTKQFRVTALSSNVWKNNVTLDDDYRALIAKLSQETIQWYTDENKHTRPINVMAQGLHPSCKTEDIINYLKEKGLKILHCENIIKKENNKTEGDIEIIKRPSFILVLDVNEDIKKIYDIKVIYMVL